MINITLKGTDLIEHTICYTYNKFRTPEDYRHYIIPKEYFEPYFKKIIKFYDIDAGEDCIRMFCKHSDDMIINDYESYLFDSDQITFSFDNEEEALYFKLKYNV